MLFKSFIKSASYVFCCQLKSRYAVCDNRYLVFVFVLFLLPRKRLRGRRWEVWGAFRYVIPYVRSAHLCTHLPRSIFSQHFSKSEDANTALSSLDETDFMGATIQVQVCETFSHFSFTNTKCANLVKKAPDICGVLICTL